MSLETSTGMARGIVAAGMVVAFLSNWLPALVVALVASWWVWERSSILGMVLAVIVLFGWMIVTRALAFALIGYAARFNEPEVKP